MLKIWVTSCYLKAFLFSDLVITATPRLTKSFIPSVKDVLMHFILELVRQIWLFWSDANLGDFQLYQSFKIPCVNNVFSSCGLKEPAENPSKLCFSAQQCL